MNEVHLRVTSDPGIEKELWDFFSFHPPNYQYSPAFTGKKWDPHSRRYVYTHRYWDGKIRLYNAARNTIYVGLLDYVKAFAQDHGYKLDIELGIDLDTEFSEVEALDFIKSLNLPFPPQPEQLKALVLGVRKRRQLFLSPTGSGKSLIIYLLTRYFNTKTLIVVPTTALCGQMLGDFGDYGWDAESNVHVSMEGASKTSPKRVIVATWQSIWDQPKDYFKDFGLIIGDEAHGFKAASLETLMKKTTTTPIKIGLTGTIHDTQVHKLVLEGLFGPVRELVKTKTLQERGFLAGLNIKLVTLSYPETVRKAVSKLSYQDEVDYIVSSSTRLKFIKNLSLSLKGNTLLLFHLVDKHGKIIYDELSKSCGDRKVFFIHGKVEAEERNTVRGIVEQETDAIIVASYGTFSTGINIKNLNNLILATAFKSKIRNLQSIGRGLRRSETKDTCTLFDLSDDFSYKGKLNYSLKHLMKRLQLYNEEGFPCKLYKVELGGSNET